MGGHFEIRLLAGRMLKDTSTFGVQSPYVMIQLGEEERRSSICRGGGVSPEWNEVLLIPHVSDTILHIVVRNKGLLRNELIGKGKVDLAGFLDKKQTKLSVPLTTQDKRSRGEVILQVLFASMILEKDIDAGFAQMKIRNRDVGNNSMPQDRNNNQPNLGCPVQPPPASPYLHTAHSTPAVSAAYPRVPAMSPPNFPGSFGSSADSAGTGFMGSRDQMCFPPPEQISYGRTDSGAQPPSLYITEVIQEESEDRDPSALSQPHIAYNERQDAHRPNSRAPPGNSFYPGTFFVGPDAPGRIPYLSQPMVDNPNDFETV